jgi:two-component system, OmpR family, phosphate regulon sensor histidine kinase PhoR
MRNVDGHLRTATNAGAAARQVSWSMTAVAEPQKFSDFEALLLAIAGHDLPQPLQAIQSAQELFGNGVRTRSGLHHLASSQIAINRLTEQLDQHSLQLFVCVNM